MISDEWLKKLSDSKMTILPGGLMDGVERISATEMADEIISLRSQVKALVERCKDMREELIYAGYEETYPIIVSCDAILKEME